MKQLTTIFLFLLSSCTKAQTGEIRLDLTKRETADKTIKTIGTAGRYNAFSCVFPVNGLVYNTYRSGTTHLQNGRLDMVKYDPYAKTLTSPLTVLTPPSGKDFRAAVGGVVGGEKLALFTSLYNPTSDAFESMGYTMSTDLSGSTWSAYTTLSLPTGVTRFTCYGNLVATETPNVYYQPAYGFTAGRAESVVWYYKVVYAAGAIATSIVEMYRGPDYLTETAMERLGSGIYIAMARVDGRNVLQQMISTDGGLTWSAPTDTNLGNGQTYTTNSTKDCVPDIKRVGDSLYCLLQNRNTGYLQIARLGATANGATAQPTATAWAVTNYQLLNVPGLGYPTMTLLPGMYKTIVLNWSKETSSTNALVYLREENFN